MNIKFNYWEPLLGTWLLLVIQILISFEWHRYNNIQFFLGFCGTIAVITFGALGDSRDWMPDFEHNFLSWSFGLAVVGTFGLYLCATLFFIEAKVQAKKQRDTTSQATFSLEHKVWSIYNVCWLFIPSLESQIPSTFSSIVTTPSCHQLIVLKVLRISCSFRVVDRLFCDKNTLLYLLHLLLANSINL